METHFAPAARREEALTGAVVRWAFAEGPQVGTVLGLPNRGAKKCALGVYWRVRFAPRLIMQVVLSTDRERPWGAQLAEGQWARRPASDTEQVDEGGASDRARIAAVTFEASAINHAAYAAADDDAADDDAADDDAADDDAADIDAADGDAVDDDAADDDATDGDAAVDNAANDDASDDDAADGDAADGDRDNAARSDGGDDDLARSDDGDDEDDAARSGGDDGVACDVCGSAEDAATMLLCEGCDRGRHLRCCLPPLDATPAGDWFCRSPCLGWCGGCPPTDERGGVRADAQCASCGVLACTTHHLEHDAAATAAGLEWRCAPCAAGVAVDATSAGVVDATAAGAAVAAGASGQSRACVLCPITDANRLLARVHEEDAAGAAAPSFVHMLCITCVARTRASVFPP